MSCLAHTTGRLNLLPFGTFSRRFNRWPLSVGLNEGLIWVLRIPDFPEHLYSDSSSPENQVSLLLSSTQRKTDDPLVDTRTSNAIRTRQLIPCDFSFHARYPTPEMSWTILPWQPHSRGRHVAANQIDIEDSDVCANRMVDHQDC
jgi:hypothetical protein